MQMRPRASGQWIPIEPGGVGAVEMPRSEREQSAHSQGVAGRGRRRRMRESMDVERRERLQVRGTAMGLGWKKSVYFRNQENLILFRMCTPMCYLFGGLLVVATSFPPPGPSVSH